MEEHTQKTSTETGTVSMLESSKPMAFTIDFGNDKKVDTQRHKTLSEKFQQRHKRGKSMSKLEDSVATMTATVTRKHPLTGNLPRKSSFQSEGYFSSDEKGERSKNAKVNTKRNDLTLFLKNVTSDRMTQSFPNTTLPSIRSPEECELQNISSPEFEMISPFSPNAADSPIDDLIELAKINSCDQNLDQNLSAEANEFNFDKRSDTVSDAGTYTLEVDNYSEEQKARMSIDKEFKIEQVSVKKKTEEYIKSLSFPKTFIDEGTPQVEINSPSLDSSNILSRGRGVLPVTLPNSCSVKNTVLPNKILSPILSPTQNFSICEEDRPIEKKLEEPLNNDKSEILNKTFTKTFPIPNRQFIGQQRAVDEGIVISVTSSGAFRSRCEEKKKLERKLSLTKSEVQVEAYIDGKSYNDQKLNNQTKNTHNLTANIVNVQSIAVGPNNSVDLSGVVSASLLVGKMSKVTSGLPPMPIGKTSPTKIPSPVHTWSRPRSRNSLTTSIDDSDTEIILKPTQNYINALQHKLSLDSDPDSDYEIKYGLQLNNTAHLLKQRASHIRHNSLDDRTINNKLEHFQNKNLQGIDQTYSNLLNQYKHNVVNKINNSPSNSPIRRSSSFSNRNQINSPKNTNISVFQKESNLCSFPNLSKNNSIQRSSSAACIKPNYITNRRSSIPEHKKIDRSQFGDTESSSEDDFDKTLQKRKDLGNISNTRCNRTFSLRRARLDNELSKLKCPNTPEMRRKSFQPETKPERAISVDRKSIKSNEVQSRYLLNISKRATPPPAPKEISKNVAKTPIPAKTPAKLAQFSRTEAGRFSMRTPKTPTLSQLSKSAKKDGKNSKQSSGGRSNSTLSSREVEFQNWKRRKSYDPMKAAAEGKRKEMQKKQNTCGSYSEVPGRTGVLSPDSSPSHSGSVHRSQSFHGTAALEQLISSDEEDLTLSAEEGFSPPTPSPCELSPTRTSLRHNLWERIHN